MKILSTLLIFILCSKAVCGETAAPNFIVIMGEAQGWASSSVQMDDTTPASKSRLARTPNLEAVAAGGMRFANFYAASPRCMPTRAALFTGKNPAALHMTYIGEGKRDETTGSSNKLIPPKVSLELPPNEVTVASLLKGSGYATAHFGKWHVGRIDPSKYGFDESDGATSNVGPSGETNPNPAQAFSMTERGMDFMSRQVKAGKPFYLQLSHYAGDGGTAARPETYSAVRRRASPGDEKLVESVAMTEDMDATIGLLLGRLDALGVTERTYFIYTSDHGSKGHNANGPLNGGKGSVWEGGVRVPLLVRGPGVKPGSCTQVTASTADLMPTISQLAGVKSSLPKNVEGGSLVPVLQGKPDPVKRLREEFVVHFPHYDKDGEGPASSLISGAEKLIRVYETGRLYLFNLKNDLGERRDLSTELPQQTKDLDRRLSDYLLAVGASMPTPNPAFDPSNPAPIMQKRGERKKEKGPGQ